MSCTPKGPHVLRLYDALSIFNLQSIKDLRQEAKVIYLLDEILLLVLRSVI